MSKTSEKHRWARGAIVLKRLAHGEADTVELAGLLAMTPHHTNRLLRELRADGLVRVSRYNGAKQFLILADGQPDAVRPTAARSHDPVTQRIREAEQAAGIERNGDPEMAMQIEADVKRERARNAIGRLVAAGQHPDPIMRAMYAR